jgi:acetyl esterase/lipase
VDVTAEAGVAVTTIAPVPRARAATRSLLFVLTVLAAVTLAGCNEAADKTSSTPKQQQEAKGHLVGTEAVGRGVKADVYLPTGKEAPPVVLLVPGGGWATADRTGLGQLAEHLAAAGAVVVNTTYRTQKTEDFFPTPVQDVVCAMDFAAEKASSEGMAGGPLIVVGHSAGAHLAALAALVADQFQDGCSHPPVQADGLIGLAGPYDIAKAGDAAWPLFGKTLQEAPKRWRAANPLTWAASNPQLRVLLVHGSADDVVPTAFTANFDKALRAGGHQVQVSLLKGLDHGDVYQAGNVGDVMTKWIAALQSSEG